MSAINLSNAERLQLGVSGTSAAGWKADTEQVNLTPMRNAKRTEGGTISVDGENFEWRLHREPQWCTSDGWRGMVLAVRHVEGQREAMVEWPMPKVASNSVPYRQRPKIDAPLLSQAVTAAIQAGWDPLSRGKPVNVLIA